MSVAIGELPAGNYLVQARLFDINQPKAGPQMVSATLAVLVGMGFTPNRRAAAHGFRETDNPSPDHADQRPGHAGQARQARADFSNRLRKSVECFA